MYIPFWYPGDSCAVRSGPILAARFALHSFAWNEPSAEFRTL